MQKYFTHQASVKKTEAYLRTLPGGRLTKDILYSGLVFTSFVIGCLMLPWQQTSKGKGRVLALSPNERPQVLSAPVDARIERWFVVEGQSVKAGDKIVKLTDLDAQIITRLESQINAVKKKIAATEVIVETSKKNVDRSSYLLKHGLISQRDEERSRQEYASALVNIANAQNELAKLEVSLSRQLAQEIVAPLDGYIIAIKAGQGGAIVKSGDELATLVPQTDSRVVELFVDGNDLPLIESGNQVMLQFEGWPAIQFSGAPDLAYGTFAGRVVTVDPYDMDRGLFRLIVSEDQNHKNGQWPSAAVLRQGVRVKGWVLLGVVTVGYEIWRRMNGFPLTRDQEAYRHRLESNSQDKKNDNGKKGDDEK
jgi:multidrug resistance efflux pump